MSVVETVQWFQFNVTGRTFVAFGLFTFDWLVALVAHEDVIAGIAFAKQHVEHNCATNNHHKYSKWNIVAGEIGTYIVVKRPADDGVLNYFVSQ